MASSIERYLTRDGGLIQFGPEFYLLARMAEATETVRVVDAAPSGPSLIDGANTMRYVVRSARGNEYIVEPWQLSRVPPDELYRDLRGHRPPTRVPVSPIRLSA